MPDSPLLVFLDDERAAPPGWTRVRWPEQAVALLETGRVAALSLDHDLCDPGDLRTGYTVLLWLEEAVATRGFAPPAELLVHSANSSAREKMLRAIGSIRRLAIPTAEASAEDAERLVLRERVRMGDLRREHYALAGWLGHPAVDGHAPAPPPLDPWVRGLEGASPAALLAITIGIGWATLDADAPPALAEALRACERVLDTDALDPDAVQALSRRVLATEDRTQPRTQSQVWTVHRALELLQMGGAGGAARQLAYAALTAAVGLELPEATLRQAIVKSLLRPAPLSAGGDDSGPG